MGLLDIIPSHSVGISCTLGLRSWYSSPRIRMESRSRRVLYTPLTQRRATPLPSEPFLELSLFIWILGIHWRCSLAAASLEHSIASSSVSTSTLLITKTTLHPSLLVLLSPLVHLY